MREFLQMLHVIKNVCFSKHTNSITNKLLQKVRIIN